MSEELCRDFDNGKCNRGKRCRFYHPKLLICKDFQNKGCTREKCKFLHITHEEEESYENGDGLPEHIDEKDAKHKRIMRPSGGGQGFGGGMYGKRRRDDGFNFNIMPDVSAIPNALMEENEMLKRKITELQRQVMDLRQMNDTLYDQNTRFRNQVRGTTGATAQADPYSKTGAGLTSVGVNDLVANRNYYDFTAAGS